MAGRQLVSRMPPVRTVQEAFQPRTPPLGPRPVTSFKILAAGNGRYPCAADTQSPREYEKLRVPARANSYLLVPTAASPATTILKHGVMTGKYAVVAPASYEFAAFSQIADAHTELTNSSRARTDAPSERLHTKA